MSEAASTQPLVSGRPSGLTDRWVAFLVSLMLAASTWFVFGQTLLHGFINFDDDIYVYENPNVAHGLTLKGIVWAFTDVHGSNWHPLTWIAHMVDCQLFGLNPGGHHFTSIVLHAATAILLFLVLRRMSGALWRSAFVAAVFVLHPLRVESVAWVAECKDVLCGLFFVLTLGAYVRYVRQPWSLGRYLIVVAMMALGLMSKPMLVTLPFVLLLLDYWPLQRFLPVGDRKIVRQLVLEKLPLLALSGAACVVTLFAQKEALTPMPLLIRIGNALVSYVTYLGQMFYPAGLAVYYPHPGEGLPLWEVLAAAILLLAITAGAIATREKRPWFLFGWLWYLGMLVPVIGILQVGSQAQADRYTYLPQIGLYVLLTWTVANLCAGWRHRRLVLGGLAAVVLVPLIFCARTQTVYWRNSEALWTHALACTSNNVIAHDNLGNVLLLEGKLDEAMAHFQTALQISPVHAKAHNNLGNVLLQKGRAGEALVHFQTALQIDPNLADAHNNLGIVLSQSKRADEALVHFETALQINPNHADAHNNLGTALLNQGRLSEAMVHFQRTLEIRPVNREAHYNFGNALLQMGNLDDAVAHYQTALQIKPDYADAHNNLGYVLLQLGRVDEAFAHFEATLKIDPDNANAHYNFGTALIAQDRLDEAMAHLKTVQRLRPNSAQAFNTLGFVLIRRGRLREAIAQYQIAVELQPDNARTLSNLAWVLATCPEASLRNGPRAIELAQRANQLSGGQNPAMLRTLAAALADGGQFGEAVKVVREALRLASAPSDTAMRQMLGEQIKLYEAGAPFRDASLADAANPSGG